MLPNKPIYEAPIVKGLAFTNFDPGNRGWLDSTYKILRGRVSFGSVGVQDNMQGILVKDTNTGAADTEFVLTHNLLNIPIGYITVFNTTKGVVYNGPTAWTDKLIYLKCSVANASIIVFVFY